MLGVLGVFVDAAVEIVDLSLVAAVHVVDRRLPGSVLEGNPSLLSRGGICPTFSAGRIVSGDWIHNRGGQLVKAGVVDEDGRVEALIASLTIAGAPPTIWDPGVACPTSAVLNVVPRTTLQALSHRLAAHAPSEDLVAARTAHIEPLPVQQIRLSALPAEIGIGAFGASIRTGSTRVP